MPRRLCRSSRSVLLSYSVPCPSATLTVWASAWLHGAAAPDDVIDALHTWAELHEVVAADPHTGEQLELPTPEQTPTSVVGLLAAARRAGIGAGRLLLPVPGDVRGLPPEGPLGPAALEAGEVAVLASGDAAAELAVVPTGVADSVLRWTVFAPGQLPPAPEPGLPDAEHGLRGAVRQAATTLVDLDVARHRPGVRAEIAESLERRVRPPWPQGTPGRALRVLQQADEVEAILGAANTDEPGGALSASAAAARSAALRPLSTAVREARRSAVGEAVRALTPRAGRR
ncbi:MAG TPA: hypothetical protein VHH34_10150 [Pseudonocardiaceae bacterium]|nr:hypothetical protein [Pseudonocardiaceae bacterium]